MGRAFVLLFAATNSGTVSGFTCHPSTRHRVALHQQVSPLFSEVEEAAEATSEISEVGETAESTVEESSPVVVEETPALSEVEEAAEATSEISEVGEPAELTGEESSPAVDEETSAVFDKTIYIGNLSFDAEESDIKTAFDALGTVTKV